MGLFIIIFGLFLVICAALFLFDYFNSSKSVIIENKNDEVNYISKDFMTNCELEFYNKIKELEIEYKIVPQINLATIIKKDKIGYANELFRNIDFGIFDINYNKLLLLIELNDSSHNNPDRKRRDFKVREICKSANVKLITFYTNCSNEKNYVLNRIRNEILFNENIKSEN